MPSGPFISSLSNCDVSIIGTPDYDLYYLEQLCRRGEDPTTINGAWLNANLGADVDIYLVSTGVDLGHVELTSKCSYLPGFTHSEGDSDVQGMGTAAAGLLVSSHFGIAEQATLYSAKLFAEDGTWTQTDVNSIVTAILDNVTANPNRYPVVCWLQAILPTKQEPTVVPPSDDQDALQKELKRLYAQRIPIIVPAGDGFMDDGVSIGYLNAALVRPGRMEEVITVGAVNRDNTPYQYTCYGKSVNGFLPGSQLFSCGISHYFTQLSGTFPAAAMGAALVALIRQAIPSLRPDQIKTFLAKNGEIATISISYDVATRDAMMSTEEPLYLKFLYSSGKSTLIRYPYELGFYDVLYKAPWVAGEFVHSTPNVSIRQGKHFAYHDSNIYFLSVYGDVLRCEWSVESADFDLFAIGESVYGTAPNSTGTYNAVIKVSYGDVYDLVPFTFTVQTVSDTFTIEFEIYKALKEAYWVGLKDLSGSNKAVLKESLLKRRKVLVQQPQKPVVLLDRITGQCDEVVESDDEGLVQIVKANSIYTGVILSKQEQTLLDWLRGE